MFVYNVLINFIMEHMKREWMQFVLQTKKNREVVAQLSKLYIILHENVRQTILKCTIDLKYDPTEDCRRHLTTILDLLQRLNDPKDTYLREVDPQILTKYQEQLCDLSEQVQKLLKTHNNVKDIDVSKLQGIKQTHNNIQYNLKDQLKRSEQRKLKSRSGRKKSQGAIGMVEQDQQLIVKFDDYKKDFLKKKQKLQKQMEGHIERQNNQIIFNKKYKGTSLQEYFKLRSDIVDLQIADQFARKIVQEQQQRPKMKEITKSPDGLEQKLFPEFKIKTKFMKSQVKENILNALVDVKMKLLEEYHLSNLKKLSQGNPDTLITLLPQKKNESIIQTDRAKTKKQMHSQTRHTTSAHTLDEPTKTRQKIKTTRYNSVARYPMASKTCRPVVYKSGWSDEIEQMHRKTLVQRLFQGKVPNTKNCINH